jgi:membrane-associated protein
MLDWLDWFVDVISGSPWTYAVLFAVSALDAIFPIVPSETAVITGGVVAASGDLQVGLVVLAAAGGAFLGDNVTYAIGRFLGHGAAEKIARGEKGKRSLDWARRTLDNHGGLLIVVARFIPGGRIATMLTAGLVDYPWKRRFLPADALAAVLWALYSGLVGYLGGRTFEEEPWKALLLAFGIAFGIAVVVEGVRRLRHRRG